MKPDVKHTNLQLYRLLSDKQVLRLHVDDVLRHNIFSSIHKSENVPKTSPVVLVLKQLSTGTNDLTFSYYRFVVTSETLILFRIGLGTKFLTYGTPNIHDFLFQSANIVLHMDFKLQIFFFTFFPLYFVKSIFCFVANNKTLIEILYFHKMFELQTISHTSSSCPRYVLASSSSYHSGKLIFIRLNFVYNVPAYL